MPKCSERSKTALSSYIGKDPAKIKNVLAQVLANEGRLDMYALKPDLNECMMSYPDSDWYGVYVTDQNGNKYFKGIDGNVVEGIYYFKVKMVSGKPYADEGTFELPKELENVSPCTISEKGNCVNPPKATNLKTSKIKLPDDIVSGIEVMSINKTKQANVMPPSNMLRPTKSVPQKGTYDKKMFEAMPKEKIIDFMISNLDIKDLANCVLDDVTMTSEDKAVIEKITQSVPSSSSSYEEQPKELSNEELSKIRKKYIREITRPILALGNDERVAAMIKYLDESGVTDVPDDPDDIEDLFEETVNKRADKYIKLGKFSAFGKYRKGRVSAAQKRVRANFRKAAKKCKKSKGKYISCMKRMLKKCKTKSSSFGKKKKSLTKKAIKLPNNFNKKIIKGYNKGRSVSTKINNKIYTGSCLLYTSPSPRDRQKSRMPSSA